MKTKSQYIFTFIVFIALLASQGGYFSWFFLIVSALCCVAYFVLIFVNIKHNNNERRFQKKYGISSTSIFLFLIGCLYLVSAFTHQLTATSIICACVPFALTVFSQFALLFTDSTECATNTTKSEDKASSKIYELIAWIGVGISVFGILAFLLLNQVNVFVMSGRLAFPFGYSNTSAIWYCVVAILCYFSQNQKLRYFTLLPVVALFFTKSVSAIILGFAVFLIVVIRVVTSKHSTKYQKIRGIVSLVVSVLFLATAIIFFSDRILEASQTIIERYIQIIDGLKCATTSLFNGIGPDIWQFVYPYVQTAQYTAAKIHCSYLQILLDAGIFAFLLLLMFVAYKVFVLAKRRANISLLCLILILVHSLVDFDFSFPLILILLIFLVDFPVDVVTKREYVEEYTPRFDVLRVNSALPGIIIVSVSLIISCIGIFLNFQINKYEEFAKSTTSSQVKIDISNIPNWALKDPKISTYVVIGLVNRGQYNEIELFSNDSNYSTSTKTLYITRALIENKNNEEARIYLIDSLKNRPYCVELYEKSKELIQVNKLNDLWKNAYNEVVDYANSKTYEPNANLLDNQKLYDYVE